MTNNLYDTAKRANAIEDEIGLTLDDVLNKFTQEVGEFNDAVQKYRGRYCKQRTEDTSKVQDELGDVLMNLCSIVYRLGLDPNKFAEYAASTLGKFEERKELYKGNMRRD